MKETYIFRDELHIESTLDKEDEFTLASLLDTAKREISSIKEEILTLSKRLEEKEKPVEPRVMLFISSHEAASTLVEPSLFS